MSETKKDVQAPATVGFDLGKKVTKRLNLEPIKEDDGINYKFGGLVPAYIRDVTLEKTVYKSGEYADHEIHSIRFEFGNVMTQTDEPEKYLTIVKKMPGTQIKVDSNAEDSELKDNDPESIAKIVDDTLSFIRHIFDAWVNSPNYKEVSQADMKLQKKLFAEIPYSPSVPVEKRVKHWNEIMAFFVDFANNDGKPMWVDAKKAPLGAWLLLLPNYPEKRWYTIGNFINKGFIEPLILNDDGTIKPARILKITNPNILTLGGSSAPPSMPGGVGNLGATAPGGAPVPQNIADIRNLINKAKQG